MSHHFFRLVAAVAISGSLLLSGCGRQLTTAPLQAHGVQQGFTAGSLSAVRPTAHRAAPSLSEMMAEASSVIGEAYPNSQLYEVSGTSKSGTMVVEGDFDSWTFGAIDDTKNPKNTVVVEFKNGRFSRPSEKKGLDYGRRVADITPRIGLQEAIAKLRRAGHKQAFNYVDLYKVINPGYNQAFYVFSAPTALVVVGAEDGVVTKHRPGDWPAAAHAGI